MKATLIIWAWLLGGWIQDYAYHRHLTTDPSCAQYRAPRKGSWLDRSSRGVDCTPCLVKRAFEGP